MSLGFPVAIATDLATLAHIPSDEPDVFDIVADRWEAAALWSAILALPQPDREVVALRHGLVGDGPLEWLDICLLLHCSDRTARRAERRGLDRLRETAHAQLPG